MSDALNFDGLIFGGDNLCGDASDEYSFADTPSQVALGTVRIHRRPGGHVVVFANEKGGVGKSTLAFHACIALCRAGHRVTAIDLDLRQQSLTTVLDNRSGTARSLGIDLPRPAHATLQQPSGAGLAQEIARLGSSCDFVVIDVAGHDSALARYAIAMADTLVTPLNSSFVDINQFGRIDPLSLTVRAPGKFAELAAEIGKERIRMGMEPTDWVLVKNRVRAAERRQQARIDKALSQLAPELGFRFAQGLAERVIYRELFPFGLSSMDLPQIPGLGRSETQGDGEIERLMADLGLDLGPPSRKRVERPAPAKVLQSSRDAFTASLRAHLRPATV